MNKLLLTTKTYVKNGSINLTERMINSVLYVINNTTRDEFNWMIIISNFDELVNGELWDKFTYYIHERRIILATTPYPMSCSQARGFVYEYLHYHKKITFDYTFDIDDDDLLIGQDKLLQLIHSDKMVDDLVGFGLTVSPEYYMRWHTWDFEDTCHLMKSRRYLTSDSQTMFLFFHSRKVCDIIYEDNWVVMLPKDNPHEKCEDTKMAVRLAKYNYEHEDKLTIGIINCNFLYYNIHEGQMSNDTLESDRKELQSLLLKYGYNYVTGKFYILDGNKIHQLTKEQYEAMYIH